MKRIKKVFLITRHAVVNYGSLLQTEASQIILKRLGFKTVVLNYISPNERLLKRTWIFSQKHFSNGFLRFFYFLLKLPDETIKEIRFKHFRKKSLIMTSLLHKTNDFEKIDFSDSFVCAGSDQIWGVMPNGKVDYTYFLDFPCEGAKKFSLSSSLGLTDLHKIDFSLASNLFCSFSFITVRERSAVSLIKQILPEARCKEILDPTLLLGKTYWKERANLHIRKDETFIINYSLRRNPDLEVFVEKLSKNTGLPIIRITSSLFNFGFGKKAYLPSPDKFLSLFSSATYIVTDSFHACCFSVIFGKRFLVFLPNETQNRICEFLSKLSLNNRIASSNDFLENKAKIDQDISYEEIYNKLDLESDTDISYLKERLKEINEPTK